VHIFSPFRARKGDSGLAHPGGGGKNLFLASCGRVIGREVKTKSSGKRKKFPFNRGKKKGSFQHLGRVYVIYRGRGDGGRRSLSGSDKTSAGHSNMIPRYQGGEGDDEAIGRPDCRILSSLHWRRPANTLGGGRKNRFISKKGRPIAGRGKTILKFLPSLRHEGKLTFLKERAQFLEGIK